METEHEAQEAAEAQFSPEQPQNPREEFLAETICQQMRVDPNPENKAAAAELFRSLVLLKRPEAQKRSSHDLDQRGDVKLATSELSHWLGLDAAEMWNKVEEKMIQEREQNLSGLEGKPLYTPEI